MRQDKFRICRKAKILICSPYSSFGGGGQIQTWFRNVLKKAYKKGEFETLNINSHRSGVRGYVSGLLNAKRCRARIASQDILILQSHFNPGTILLGHYSAACNVPYILVPRGDFVPSHGFYRVLRRPLTKLVVWKLFGKCLLNKAAAVVVTSKMEGDRLHRAGAYADRMVVIPDPFYADIKKENSEFQMDADADNGWEANRPFALFLGRIAREKGLEFLIKCWRTVLKKCPHALLILAGSVSHPEVYRNLLKLRRKLGLNKSVLFMDWVSGQDKVMLLEKARCLVLPSHFESFGGVVLEALAKQTPVVVSTGTPWQHIDGTCGRWLPREVSEWVDAMEKYLCPEEKIKVPLSISQSVLAQYSEGTVVKKWAVLFKKIILSSKFNDEL